MAKLELVCGVIIHIVFAVIYLYIFQVWISLQCSEDQDVLVSSTRYRV